MNDDAQITAEHLASAVYILTGYIVDGITLTRAAQVIANTQAEALKREEGKR